MLDPKVFTAALLVAVFLLIALSSVLLVRSERRSQLAYFRRTHARAMKLGDTITATGILREAVHLGFTVEEVVRG